MGFMWIAGVIIILVSWFRNDISGVLYGLFYIVCYFVWRSTEQKKEERERAEEEQNEKLAKLSDEFQKKIDASEEQIKKLKDDLLLKDIILTLGCSPDDAPRYLSLIHDTGLTYEFEDASYADKREIIYNAEKIAAFYKDELTPSMQRMHCPITFSDYIHYESSFSDDIYSDIPIDQKILMVYRNISDDGIDDTPINTNKQILRDIIKKDNLSYYQQNITVPCNKMSRDDIRYLFSLFAREFQFTDVGKDDFDDFMDYLSYYERHLSFSDYEISIIFSHCLYSFALNYFDAFTKQIADHIIYYKQSMLRSIFEDFSTKLFFDKVFFDITECKNVILEKCDNYLQMLSEANASFFS